MTACRFVLVVEDDPGIRDTIRELLELEGHRVRTAPDGRAALEVIENCEAPCLILLDLMMPVMNGWEFLAAFSNRPKDAPAIPVVVISGAADTLDATRYGHRLLRKPLDIDELMSLVEEHCPGAAAL